MVPVVTKRVTGILFALNKGQPTSIKDLSASSILIPIAFFGSSPSLIIVSTIKSKDRILYFSFKISLI